MKGILFPLCNLSIFFQHAEDASGCGVNFYQQIQNRFGSLDDV